MTVSGIGGYSPALFLPARSLYIHVPFCRSRCRYCDFYSTSTVGQDPSVIDSIIRSTLVRADALAWRFGCSRDGDLLAGHVFDTVFIGGGTPTRLDSGQLHSLLSGIRNMTSGCIKEWTIEANPESLNPEKLAIMADVGVTRISIGVQSLDDSVLSMLGRPCDAATAISAVRLAIVAGFSVSADLMTALPSPKRYIDRRSGARRASENLSWQAGILIGEGIRHISIYDLIVEEGTPIAGDIASGRLWPVCVDAAADDREAAEVLLADHNFQRYEISNYALPGNECLHNQAYWRMDSWIGSGPGAVSSITVTAGGPHDGGTLRISEWPDLDKRDSPGAEEWITPADSAFEMMMMAFRTARGLDREEFVRRFGYPPEFLAGTTFDRWKDRFRSTDPGFLALDARGMDLSNRFLSECLLEMEGKQGVI